MAVADYEHNSNTNFSDEDKVDYDALLMQFNKGDCNTPQPGMFSRDARYKWGKWNDLKGMSQIDAAIKFVQFCRVQERK